MEIKITGTEQILKDLARARILLDELEQIIQGFRCLGRAGIAPEDEETNNNQTELRDGDYRKDGTS